jgi:hypothetical protein
MITLEHILELARQLKPEEQTALIESLQHTAQISFTHHDARIEIDRRKAAGAVIEDLYGRYAQPPVDLSKEKLEETLREAGTAWNEDVETLL